MSLSPQGRASVSLPSNCSKLEWGHQVRTGDETGGIIPEPGSRLHLQVWVGPGFPLQTGRGWEGQEARQAVTTARFQMLSMSSVHLGILFHLISPERNVPPPLGGTGVCSMQGYLCCDGIGLKQTSPGRASFTLNLAWRPPHPL